ncbi:MAG TPA: CoA-acylating methylmalonate-semialdehyde dehydrogenase [Candidatus Dormibacteraeota bacterium]|nr:CoA-acylating methylmalonate-semialdehyde dehydrogenase [Candidatus Dormibacteraeota bacterium]
MIATKTIQAYIGGKFRESRNDKVDPIPNPATGETIATLPYSSREEINEAVAAAKKAFPGWSETPVPDRAQVMFRFKALFDSHIDELSALVTQENGKTLDESRGEVKRAIEVIDFACGAPTLMMGTNLDQIARGIDEELTRFPVGVVAGITPFNFPNMVPMWMIPVAIVTGNTFILKPSQLTPLSAMRIAELLQEAGLPEGVFNVVHGANDAVNQLLTHPDVAAISFVGSATVAAYIYKTAAEHGKRVQALGGAKNHILVMDDADPELSAPHVISSAFGNAGQRCLAGSVAVGVGKIGDALVRELAKDAAQLHIGPGTDPKTTLGPVIRGERKKKLIEYIDGAQAEGAQLVTDGRKVDMDEGFFLGPTIFDRVTPNMKIWKEELFGPVLSVVRASDIDEALNLLNSSTYGNMASIFTTSGKNAREFKRRAQAGMLGVNIGVAAPMAFFPFTGWKNSFFGDLHATGQDSVRFYTRHKVVTTRWL